MANATKSETAVSFQSSQYSSCEDLSHLLTQLCEEVCFLRMTKKESEERVRHLVADQHKHERQLEEEILKNSSLKEKHVQELADLDRSYQDEIQHLKREKNKLNWENESWERNVKSVKDEVRTLQLEKYNLERMIREQSHCLKTHVTASSSHLKQATEIETNFKEIKQLVERCNTKTTNLSKEVKEAIVLNKRLSFINSHHNCEKRDLETKLEGKEKIISELEINSKIRGAGVNDDKDADSKSLQQTQEIVIIREQLRETKSSEEILQKQLDQSRETNKKIIAQYEEAQKLVEQFMTGNERHKNNVSELEIENKKLKEEVENLHGAMKEKDKRETDFQQEIDKLKASMNVQENGFRSEISGLKEETEYLLKTSGILREKNGALEKRNADALAQMTKLQEELEKRQTSKADASTLTEEKCIEEGTASTDTCKNNQLIVHESKPSLCMTTEAVLGEHVLCKLSQQTPAEDCIISANSSTSTMNVANMTNHPEEEQLKKKIGAFEKTLQNSNGGSDKINTKTTQHNVTKADIVSLFNTHNSDAGPEFGKLKDDVTSTKASVGSVLLVHTTENITSKFENTKMDTSDAGFKKFPTENLATEVVNSDNVTTSSGIEISNTNLTGNTSEIADVMEEQTTCEQNSTAPRVLPRNDAEAVATGLSSANVILGISNQINVAEKEGNDEISETNDNDMSDGVGISKVVTDNNQDTRNIKKNDRPDVFPSSTGLDHADVALMAHAEAVTTASVEVNSSQVDQTKADKTTFCLTECDEGTVEGKMSSFEGLKNQEQTTFEPTVNEHFRNPDIANDGGNVSCRANECSTSVVAKISVSSSTTNGQNFTSEGCTYATTELSECCNASNLLVNTTTWKNITVSTSQMVTAAEGTKCNNANQTVSFKRNANESLGCPALPPDFQMNGSRNRQPSFIEENLPPFPKRRCVEYETSKADEINSVSIGPDDHNRDHPTFEKALKPIKITNQQLMENTPSLTAVTQISNAGDDLSSTEISRSNENVLGTRKYEHLSQRIRIITPEKPSASFVCKNPEVAYDSLPRQYSGSSSETNTSTITPIVTTPMKPQCIAEKSGEVSFLAISSIARSVPQNRLLHNEKAVSPGSDVVNLQNPEMKPNVETPPEVSYRGNLFKDARDLRGMSRSAGSHIVQPLRTFPVRNTEICAVSWSGHRGKGGLNPPTKVSLQSSTGSEVPSHGVNKEILKHSKFHVKLHDVLKEFPGEAELAFQFSQEKGQLADDKRNNVVGESVDHQPLPPGHTFPAGGFSEMDSAPGSDDESVICADHPSVPTMSAGNEENSLSIQREVEQDTSKKKHAVSQDPQINLFSDVESEEDDISSTLTKEIERAQSILNRNRLKRNRRCKTMTD